MGRKGLECAGRLWARSRQSLGWIVTESEAAVGAGGHSGAGCGELASEPQPQGPAPAQYPAVSCWCAWGTLTKPRPLGVKMCILVAGAVL